MCFSWETGWTELVKFALYGHGPDVSEIGSTWVGTLAATNALHPFGLREVAAVGGRYAFLHPSWQSCYLAAKPEMWAIPWLSNVRLVFYRADRLQQAGCCRTGAGAPARAIRARTGAVADSAAKPRRLTLATRETVNSLHNAALWIWGAGGHFIAPDGKQVQFNEPAARAGSARLLQPTPLHHAPRAVSQRSRIRSTVPARPSRRDDQRSRPVAHRGHPVTLQRRGIADSHGPAPGVPFVGGSNLVIWRHSRQEKLAFELVKFLTSQPIQTAYSTHARSLPVRLDALANPPFSTDPLYKSIVEALKSAGPIRSIVCGAWWKSG